MLDVKQLTGGYGERTIVKDVSFHVRENTMLGILGPNGSGKSTLLKMISGSLPIKSGTVHIAGRERSRYKSKELARKMAVLPQLNPHAFSHTVRDTVALGRYPYQSGIITSWSAKDEQAVQFALTQTNIAHYAAHYLSDLSGGEQQRTFIAQALAQQSSLILLDEPTNHLDLAHQQQVMELLRRQVKKCGQSVVSVFHDINLAALYCDQLLLLQDGAVYALGTPQEIITAEAIAAVYGVDIACFTHPITGVPQITLKPLTE